MFGYWLMKLEFGQNDIKNWVMETSGIGAHLIIKLNFFCSDYDSIHVIVALNELQPSPDLQLSALSHPLIHGIVTLDEFLA